VVPVFAGLVVLVFGVRLGVSGCDRKPKRVVSGCVSGDPADCGSLKSLDMNGVWKLTAFRASGRWSKGAEDAAAGFLGRTVTVDGLDVTLPDRSKCRIVSAGPTIARDGVEAFGTVNGAWSRMGFTPEPEGYYRVEEINFDCSGMFWGIVMQAEHDVHLLKVWEVYLLMKKSGA
jgi:hypothetical protein